MRPSLSAKLFAVTTMFLLPLLLPAAACAAPAEPYREYVRIRPGVFVAESGDLRDNGSNRGFAIEAAYGHTLFTHFALEAGLGFIYLTGDEYLSLIPVTLTVKGTMPTGGRVAPYAEAGGGMTNVEGRQHFLSGERDSDWAPQWHAGLGVNIQVTPRFSVGIGGRYIFLDATTFGREKSLDGLVWALNFGVLF